MNQYYQKIKEFENAIVEMAENIFRTYGKELVLRSEEYNLLQRLDDSIGLSTAIGLYVENFIISKLVIFTHCQPTFKYVIERADKAANTDSCDCFCECEGSSFLVKVKSSKGTGSKHTATAAEDTGSYHIETGTKVVKSLIVLEVTYSVCEKIKEKPMHIAIENISACCLE